MTLFTQFFYGLLPKILIFGILFCFSLSLDLSQAYAQNNGEKIEVTQRDYENQQIAMADTFREEGKIYVVVAVLATIFVGVVAYLLLMETRLRKIERELKN